MLQYCIDSLSRTEDTPVVIHCSGWLADTENLKTEIMLADLSDSEALVDTVRTYRPDLKQIFRNCDGDNGFDLKIICNEPEKLKLIFTNGKERISLPLPELKAGKRLLKMNSKQKTVIFLRQLKSRLAYFLSMPVLGLKIIKNSLFKLSPSFQKFYMKKIYTKLHPEISFSSPEQENNFQKSTWGEHILLASHFADGSGAPMLALNIARTLYGFGFNLHIIVMRDGELHDSFSKLGTVDVVTSEDELRNKLQEWENNSIKIKKAFLNTTLTGIFAKVLKEAGITTVNLIHEMPGTVTVMGQHEAANVLRTHADKIVIPSSLISDLWKENNMELPADRCIVMPQPDYHNDLEPLKDDAEKQECHAALCRELNIPENSCIVIGCGSLEIRKAPDVFFQTAFEVSKENPNVHFVWIGDAGDQFYRKKIDLLMLKAPRNTRLLSYRKLNNYYRGADLFFLPSKEDPFPTVGLLASKVGIPVIFCRLCTGLHDLFGNVAGCSSDDYSSDIFTKLILKHASDRDFSKQAGAEFLNIYGKKMYSFRDYVQSLYELAGEDLPKITAIIPNYNYANFLPERVESIVNQTFPVYELLILDDCSKDNSAEVAEKLIRKYKNHFRGGIQYLPNEQNAGVFRQWYKGVSLAKGDLIWIAEADDKCRETMQSKLVHAFRDPLVKIAYAQSALIDGDGEIYSETFLQHTFHISKYKWTQDYIWDARTETETALAIKNTIPNASGALIRKTAFSQIPEDLFSYKVIGDWFAYLHMIQDGKVAFCAEPLNLYRRHPGSVVAKNPDRLLEELKTLYAVICEKFEVSNYTRSQMLREFNETRLLLKSSIKMTEPAADQFREDKPVEYWILPEDVDWNGFKAEISKSNAAYLFIMLSGNNTEFPSNAAETFNGSVHVFWKNEVKNKEFLKNFTTWQSGCKEKTV